MEPGFEVHFGFISVTERSPGVVELGKPEIGAGHESFLESIGLSAKLVIELR